MPKMTLEERIIHIQQANKISHDAMLFLLQNNEGLNISRRYEAEGKTFKMQITIKEVETHDED